MTPEVVRFAVPVVGGFLAFMAIYWATGAGFKEVKEDWAGAFSKFNPVRVKEYLYLRWIKLFGGTPYIYYHYSPRPNISSFRHFTHFGTRRAAEDVCLRKLEDERITDASHTMYTVSIDVGAAKWVDLEDSDSPTPGRLAHHLNEYFAGLNESALVKDPWVFSHISQGDLDLSQYGALDLSDEFIKFAKSATGYDQQYIKEQARAEGYRILANELVKRGYAGIRYLNAHEDAGSISFAVADTSLVKIRGKEPLFQ